MDGIPFFQIIYLKYQLLSSAFTWHSDSDLQIAHKNLKLVDSQIGFLSCYGEHRGSPRRQIIALCVAATL